MIHIKVAIFTPPGFNVDDICHRYCDKKIIEKRTAMTKVSFTICQCSGVLGMNCLIVVILICFCIGVIWRDLWSMTPICSHIYQRVHRAFLCCIGWLSTESVWSWSSFQISLIRCPQLSPWSCQCHRCIHIHHNHCSW